MSDRTAFLQLLPKGSVGVEVGVWLGTLSQEIIDVVQPSELHLVDPWEKNDDQTNRTSTVTRSQEELDVIYDGVLDRFGIASVIVHRDRSIDLAGAWHAPPVDWVYIDGIHTYEAVSADLAAWWPIVKAGGIISGHDMWIAGVRKAVVGFAELHGVALMEIDGNFLIAKPEEV